MALAYEPPDPDPLLGLQEIAAAAGITRRPLMGGECGASKNYCACVFPSSGASRVLASHQDVELPLQLRHPLGSDSVSRDA